MSSISSLVSAYFRGFDISCEDLQKVRNYRKECVERALEPNMSEGSTNSRKVHELLLKRFREVFAKELAGKRIIELGPGSYPFVELLSGFDIKEYVGVEPFNAKCTKCALPVDERIKIVEQDGLSYLLTQPSESAVVLSFGVFAPELYSMSDLKKVYDYYRFMAKEITRVTPKNSITIHHSITAEDFLREFGFEELPGNIRGSPIVFRKVKPNL